MLSSQDKKMAWLERKDEMNAKHNNELAQLGSSYQRACDDIERRHNDRLQMIKPVLPAEIYESHWVSMTRKSMQEEVDVETKRYDQMISRAKERHQKEREFHEADYPTDRQAQLPLSPSYVMDTSITRHPDPTPSTNAIPVTPSCLPSLRTTCTVRHEHTDGQDRLVLHCHLPPRKRISSSADTRKPKRPRLDTSAASITALRTPVATPTTEDHHLAGRTITFDEVYQNGNAVHKDFMQEYPVQSKKWYIFKCEEHEMRFNNRNPLHGAAKHLHGRSHGYPDRSHGTAIKALGYLVTDCNEQRAKLNNDAVAKAYDQGYRPQNKLPEHFKSAFRGSSSSKQIARLQQPVELATGSGQTQASDVAFPKSPDRYTSPAIGQGITNPKTFHIYLAYWKPEGRYYPAMILGWDDQAGGGLKNQRLRDTSLLQPASNPPSCYRYQSDAIVGWASGYQDGQSRVQWRKFPVMFFDESQSVGWMPAKALKKFPIYKKNAPKKQDHPFNAARRWIASREGFGSWETREAVCDKTNRSNDPADYDDSDIDFDDETGTADTEASRSKPSPDEHPLDPVLQRLLVNGGEIPGDADYSGPDEGNLNAGDSEVGNWNEPDSSGRPWAFYSLRNQKSTSERQGHSQSQPVKDNSKEIKKGIQAARQLTARECQDTTTSEREGVTHTMSSISVKRPVLATQSSPQRASSASPPMPEPSFSVSSPTHQVASVIPTIPAQISPRETISGTTSTSPMPGKVSHTYNSPVHQQVPGEDDHPDEPTVKVEEVAYTVEQHAVPGSLIGLAAVSTAEQSSRPEPRRRASLDEDETIVDRDKEGSSLEMGGGHMGNASVEEAEQTQKATTAVKFSKNAVFALSLYESEGTSWTRASDEEPCTPLYYNEDETKLGTDKGQIAVVIDPMKVVSYGREPIPNSGGKSIVSMRLTEEDGRGPVRVMFDRKKGDEFDTSKVQVNRFIRWLRSVNEDITCPDA
ncbi:hypothetical protein F4780DRAFT_736405 [Xylariomycetidae sp. FL0641]|nr:hypothetical protein F4780DRAFT_736405 [Xylariomycetidae sp. FL0641]